MTSKDFFYNTSQSQGGGMGFIVNYKGKPSYEIVHSGLTMLENMEQRVYGKETEDGAGIQIQIPHILFQEDATLDKITLPAPQSYGVVSLFVSKNKNIREECMRVFEKMIAEVGFKIVWKRRTPLHTSKVKMLAPEIEPDILQYFLVSLRGEEKNRVRETSLHAQKASYQSYCKNI